ncbi:MAG: MFS transporter [Lactovum sp.]
MGKKQSLLLIILNFALYISLGLPDSMIGASWPVIQETFGFSVSFVSTITIIALCFSLISSLNYQHFAQKFSSHQIIFYSMILIFIGLSLLWLAPNAYLFLLAIPFLGLGQGAIDVAVNILLAQKFSSRVMNFVHAFYGLGVTISSAISALSIKLTQSFRLAVFILLTLHLIILIFYFIHRQLFDSPIEEEKHEDEEHEKLQAKHWLFPLFYFLYAVEQVFGLFIASYAVFLGKEPAYAAMLASIYWFCLMLGRFISGFIIDYLKSESYLYLLLFISLIASFLLYFNPLLASGLLGLGFSGLYPTLMMLPHQYLPKHLANEIVNKNISAAVIGTLLLPVLCSQLIKFISFHTFPSFCLFFILLLVINILFLVKFNKKVQI